MWEGASRQRDSQGKVLRPEKAHSVREQKEGWWIWNRGREKPFRGSGQRAGASLGEGVLLEPLECFSRSRFLNLDSRWECKLEQPFWKVS